MPGAARLTDEAQVCSRMSRYLARNLQGKQKAWNEATQKRLALTASMLSSMKSLKMLGVTPHTESMVQDLRLQELEMARKVRWMMVAYNASGMFFALALCSRAVGRLLSQQTRSESSPRLSPWCCTFFRRASRRPHSMPKRPLQLQHFLDLSLILPT